MSLPKEMTEGKLWTGLPVRYLFFAGSLKFSMDMALILYTKYRSKMALFLMVPGSLEAISTIALYGRRTPLAMLATMVLCCLWFNRRQTIPRYLFILGIVFSSVFVYSIGEYRHAMQSKDWSDQLQKIELRNPLQLESLVGGIAAEAENAAYIMEAVDRSGDFNYGGIMYNHFIACYVPRQLVGQRLKSSLMIDCNLEELALKQCNHKWSRGTCTTGIAEAYSCFSYFGSLIFLLLGYIMRRLWEGATTGDIIYQLYYIAILPFAINVYNGTLQIIVAPWLHIFIFTTPMFLFAYITKEQKARLEQES
jgi:hypothetical protein